MKNRSIAKFALTAVLCPAVALGVMSLATQQAEARPVGPQCGPSYQWSCSKKGGPNFLFIGTICDKAAYEAATGRTCTAL